MYTQKIKDHIYAHLLDDERAYLDTCILKIKEGYKTHFTRIFSTLSRHLSLQTQGVKLSIIQEHGDPLIINDWSLTKAIRVYLISTIEDEDENAYFQYINGLFDYATIDESEALFASLNILSYPAKWIGRCAEGIRSNIESVQSAIMLQNKYPFHYLDENAWNQLVLKSFFTNKNSIAIYGVFDRMNDTLAEAVVDYIFERDSAKRFINPLLWIFAKPKLDERSIDILIRHFQQESSLLVKSMMLYSLADHESEKAKVFYNQEYPKDTYLNSLDAIITELEK